jgi:hypothetical protein
MSLCDGKCLTLLDVARFWLAVEKEFGIHIAIEVINSVELKPPGQYVVFFAWRLNDSVFYDAPCVTGLMHIGYPSAQEYYRAMHRAIELVGDALTRK